MDQAGIDRAREAAVWFRCRGPALVLYARQWVDGHAAEDLVQDVLMRTLAAGSAPRDPRAWLFRAVRNAATGAHRSRSRRARRERAAAAAEWFEPSQADGLDAQRAREGLLQLDERAREAVVLHVWCGLTFEQAGGVMGCSAATALRRFRDGIGALREMIEPDRNATGAGVSGTIGGQR
ncbi:MAG: sigma-70 family RNA polymerase sigma factor [Planctomyces sp.]|nr:sigma-70 family RNA polymerase sigma factor [Planctomyces sp.]